MQAKARRQAVGVAGTVLETKSLGVQHQHARLPGAITHDVVCQHSRGEPSGNIGGDHFRGTGPRGRGNVKLPVHRGKYRMTKGHKFDRLVRWGFWWLGGRNDPGRTAWSWVRRTRSNRETPQKGG